MSVAEEEYEVSFAEVDEEEGPSTEELTNDAPRTTDSANADAFVGEHGRGFLFVVEWESWIAWSGKQWERIGARQRVIHYAMLTAREAHWRAQKKLAALEESYRHILLAGQKNEEMEYEIKQHQRLLKWHEQSQNMSRLEAVTKLLETRLVVHLADLDRDPYMLNLQNGTLDLRTAELHDHRASDLITQISDVFWDEEEQCPTWDAFVSTAMGGNLELVMYLQRLVGYSLTALTSEHILVFFHGEGRNGKSTFVQTLRKMMGEYACSAPRDLLFEDKQGQRHPAELARLYGQRMAICAEIGEYVTLDEAKVKDLTGGDSVAVRRMREDFWDLEPTHTLYISGNHKPVVRGNDLGIWRRIRLVPWEVIVAEDAVDKDLPKKLEAELSGILRWAVNGCLEWGRLGLQTPSVVTEATAEYRAESDVLGQFLDRYCVFGLHEKVSRQALRERYERACEEDGHKPVSPRKIAQRLKERHVRDCSVREGVRQKNGWAGVRLKSDYEMHVESEPGSNNPTS